VCERDKAKGRGARANIDSNRTNWGTRGKNAQYVGTVSQT